MLSSLLADLDNIHNTLHKLNQKACMITTTHNHEQMEVVSKLILQVDYLILALKANHKEDSILS